ncbi:3-oxoacyl-[acyl-carrier-protein] reductase FabG-like [Pectinophora gossypiella]|uniref:3-oxoacyl-[acyl-carrier-protein] reductase FabG-like n=1 Tax=Pectinophora gossypiella TaxID=13191 RepID=UPI00214E4AF6|nr:3-oxoacyl-[acyl-carrier-protein] reductase FabG-like [Pectinophora gossypiella]
MSFENKVIIVTGASSGIGAATAILFAKEGANVVMVGRNETKLKNVSDSCAQVGKRPLVIIADVSKDEDAKRIVKETIDKFGKLDVLVNNAGWSKSGTILDGSILKSYDDTFSVNVRAVVHLTALAAPHLVKSKGNIVNVSSIAALTTPKASNMIAYFVSKAALDHFTRGAANELAPSGVRVNSVNPGPVVTDFMKNQGLDTKFEDFTYLTALDRVSQPDEIANMIEYLAGEKAVGITGSIFVVDNGMLLKM